MSAMVELAHPRKLLPRWHGHGDLHLVIDHPHIYLQADDVEHLADLTPWGDTELLLDDHAPFALAGVPHYTLDAALTKCARARTQNAHDFTVWLLTFLRDVDDTALEQAHQPIPFDQALTVAQAARALDRDPLIRTAGGMGRDRLFAHLEQLGWIERNDAAHDWIITRLPHSRDWLTLRTIRVPAPTRSGIREYLQIHVTTTGLDEIRSTLHALERGDPTTSPTTQLPLF